MGGADPTGLYTPHAAPMQMTFYTGDAFPAAYRGDAYIAMRRSWNRRPPSGYEVLRIVFEDGRPVGFEPFITGFLMEGEGPDGGWGHLGRLAGLAEGPDGALYLTDDTNGVIYRITHTGDGDPQAGALEPTNAEGAEIGVSGGDASPPADSPSDLAIEIVQPQGGPVDVVSPAFDDGALIPATYAAEGQNISPPLDWAEGPEGTQSYVVMVEDPAVPQNPPFVHWLVYDIPRTSPSCARACRARRSCPCPRAPSRGERPRLDRLDRHEAAGRRLGAPLPLPGLRPRHPARPAARRRPRRVAGGDARQRALR